MKTMSDRSVGGFSTVQLTQVPPSTDPDTSAEIPSHMLFHGHISTKLPANRPDVLRTGYTAFRNQDRGRSAFGKLYWDVDSYNYLAVRVKSDGRKYFVNIQTDSIVETDIHQHRLYTRMHRGALTRRPPPPPSQNQDQAQTGAAQTGAAQTQAQIRPHPEWETVLIPLHEFVRTNHGTVTEPQSEMLRQQLTTVGIGLTDRVPGPFSLGVAAIWATNLNERGQIDGRIGHFDGDQGSARLAEVTEEKLAARAEERASLPERKLGLKDRLPDHFGKVGTGQKGRPGNPGDFSPFR
jgi:NADH dehydrogenase [ubiquinone] 1 alpha subcomplex assembly factor 1